MGLVSKLKKACSLLRRPHFVIAAVKHRAVAATEQWYPIKFSAARTLVDIGANKGQFSLVFRAICPDSTILAFEPLPSTADTFKRVFEGDPRVILQEVALATTEGVARFHVTDRADSSSLLEPAVSQAEAFGVRPSHMIEVPIRRLDACVDFTSLPHPILLKIDVQGAELEVLKGCDTLGSVDFIYVELSFVELYKGQPMFGDVATYLETRGFELAGAFNQLTTSRYGPTQADFLFRRNANANANANARATGFS